MAITRVTTDGITDSAVSTAKIGANAVDTTKIGADVIVADDIADNAITVAQISDGAITSAKLDSSVGTITKSASAPSSPANGDVWYDTDDAKLQFYDGTVWQLIKSAFTATGGTVSDAGGYRYHQFNSSGNFVVSKGTTSVDYIIVAGGGGAAGGDYATGGGGGGAGERDGARVHVARTRRRVARGSRRFFASSQPR